MMDATDPLSALLHPPARMQPLLPAVGERLGVWRVHAALLECASGYWFQVRHGLTGQPAMALVYRHEADAQAVLMRFAEDSEALGRLSHPAFAAALDCGLSPVSQPYLVVPPLDGQPLLRGVMALPLKRRLQLLLDFIDLLDAAQARGLRLHELDLGLLWLGAQQQLVWLGQGLAPLDSQAPPLRCRAALVGADEPAVLAALLCLLVNGRLRSADGGPAAVDGPEPGANPVASLQAWLALKTTQRESLDQLLDGAALLPHRAALAQAVHDWLEDVPPSAPMPLDESTAVASAAPLAARSPAAGGETRAETRASRRPEPAAEPSAPAPAPAGVLLPESTVARRVAALLVLAAAAALGWWLWRG